MLIFLNVMNPTNLTQLSNLTSEFRETLQVRNQDLCKARPKRDYADISRSRGSGKNLGLKIGGSGGGGLDPHLKTRVLVFNAVENGK